MHKPELNALEKLSQRARSAGAAAAEVYASSELTHQLTLRATTPKVRKVEQLTVRVWTEDGREGEATGALPQADALIEQALAHAADAAPDPHAGPVPRFAETHRGLDIFDRRYEALTAADRMAALRDAFDDAASTHKSVRPGLFSWSDTLQHRALVNTRGVRLESSATTFHMKGEVSVDLKPVATFTDEVAGHSFATTACLPFGGRLAGYAASLLTAPAVISGPVRVLFRPRAAAALVHWLAECALKESLAPQSTALTTTPPLSPQLHLTDDGQHPGGLRTQAFDDRGVPPNPLHLFREGAFVGRYRSLTDARRNHGSPTGHLQAGTLRPTNLILNGGVRSAHARLGEYGMHVLSIDHLPFDLACDPRTGELDQVVHGVMFNGQSPTGSVRHMRLKGNLLDALQRIPSMTSDTDRTLHVDTPGIFVDGLELH